MCRLEGALAVATKEVERLIAHQAPDDDGPTSVVHKQFHDDVVAKLEAENAQLRKDLMGACIPHQRGQ